MTELPVALPALAGLIALAAAAGTVYGFAGFGAALLFMPVATRIVEPSVAVPVFAFSSMGSLVTVFPDAARAADGKAWLGLGAALLTLPLGLWILAAGDPLALRWGVSVVVLGTLALLVAGVRYRVTPGRAAWAGVGAAVGVLGGATGVNGPPMILFQLGGTEGVARARANTIVVLSGSSAAIPLVLWLQGRMTPGIAVLGLLLAVPYALGGLVGRRLFDPARAGLYRGIAYVIVALAGLSGLPLWD